MDEPLYNVFVRNWWKLNPSWPGGREPHMGKKKYLHNGRGVSYAQARKMCDEYARDHKPGRVSRKAEFEQCGS